MSYHTERILTNIQSNIRSSPSSTIVKSPSYIPSFTQPYKPMYTTLSHQNEIEQKYHHEELEHKPSTITANTYRNNFLSSNTNNNVYSNTGRSTSMFKVDNSSNKVDKSEIRFIVKREIESYIRMLRSEFTEALNEIRREMYTSNQVQNELANFDSTLTVQQNKIDRYTEEINNNASRLDILDKEFLKTNTELNAKIKNVNSDLTQMKIKFNKIIRNKAFFKSAAKTTFNDVNVNIDDNDHQYEIEYNDNEPDYDALYTKKLKDNEDKLKQTVKELETQIQINSAQRVDSINKELIELKNEIHTVKNEYSFNTNNKLNQYYTKQEVDTLMDNTHRNNVNHVTSSITALNEKINKIDVTQLQYQIRNEDLTKQTSLQLDEITKLKNAISTLTQSVQEQATQITQLSTRLESSNEHNKSLLNTFNTINNNSININNALHSLSQLTQSIKQHEVSIQNIQREFNTIKTTLTASNANNAVSSEFIAFKTESNAQLNVIHSKVNELSNIMDKQNKDINTQLYAITNSMNVLDSEYHSAETHLNKQLNDISTELTKQNTQINANATQIAMIYQRVNSVDQRNSYSGNSFIDKGVSCPVVDLNQLYAKVEVLNQKVPMLETQFHTFNQTQQSYNETLTLKVNQLERNKIIPMQPNNISSAIGNEEYNTITESINILNDKIPALEAKINTMSMTQQTFNNTIKQKVDAYERNRNDIVNDVKRVSNDIQVVEQKLQQQIQQQQLLNNNNNNGNKDDTQLNTLMEKVLAVENNVQPVINEVNTLHQQVPGIINKLENFHNSQKEFNDMFVNSLKELNGKNTQLEEDLDGYDVNFETINKKLLEINNNTNVLQQINTELYKQLQLLQNQGVQQKETISQWASGLKSNLDKNLNEIKNECEVMKQQITQLQQHKMGQTKIKVNDNGSDDWDLKNSNNVMSANK